MRSSTSCESARPTPIYLPSAAEVAARARVSERTVFRHFADLNALFVAAASRIRPVQQIYLGPRPDAPRVDDRIEALVGLRSKLYERIAPVRRVAIYLSQTHPLVVEQLAEAYATARAQVADVFAPELSRLDAQASVRSCSTPSTSPPAGHRGMPCGPFKAARCPARERSSPRS